MGLRKGKPWGATDILAAILNIYSDYPIIMGETSDKFRMMSIELK